MKIAEFRGKSPDELKDHLVQLKKEQFNLRFQRASGQLEGTGRIRQVRRDIARVKTVMGKGDTVPVAKAAEPVAPAPKKSKRK